MSEPTEEQKLQVLYASIAEDLRRTCLKTLEGVCEERGVEVTPKLTEAVDQEVFQCECCGWWCERSEESYAMPGQCDDCSPEDEDEDEDD